MMNSVILRGVPRINQKEGVLNGCEVASLLMGLQYKGYHQGMTLKQIAEAVPKTDDPHTGFILDIWDLLPLNQLHWIAPDALSKFGKRYYDGVIDISGASVEDLKREIDNGNPVVVYGTYYFQHPKSWCGEVPTNLHVMLMIGYNKRTGNIILIDPWGGIEIVVSGNMFATQYNLMKYAVAIR